MKGAKGMTADEFFADLDEYQLKQHSRIPPRRTSLKRRGLFECVKSRMVLKLESLTQRH